ncbi:MAG: Unknown protein [uncultured Thiotrichaceae bacterium]|uniref:Glycosyltransferase subfamily 4-like N-terminal domain-containing protein n=1 Tax=uncultured Thiotrichaceae bacterium TaxID=298394 RepID=A0A6S6TXK1_9GAMM|nr:MAG: Unknown protein [uncultured Thiotrichaceae bacterium]
MPKTLHIGLVSVVFDFKPEGICTGRLARALLGAGYQVSLIVSSKARVQQPEIYTGVHILPSGLREPRWVFNLLACLRREIPSNFYTWTRHVKSIVFFQHIPDVIYARAWPHASLVAGYELAKKHHIPLILHFSDPFPPTDLPHPQKQLMLGLQKMVDAADALTFTNEQTIAYQQRFLAFDHEKAYVIPHVTMQPRCFGPTSQAGMMAYIGTARENIGQVDELVEGFAKYCAEHDTAELHFVGSDKNYVNRLQGKAQAGSILFHEYLQDVTPMMEQADVLVLVDPNVEYPIVSATKLLEYLGTDRKILGITPQGSPSDDLLRQFPESCIAINDYNAEKVAEGILAIFHLKPDASVYTHRHGVLETYLPGSVAARFDTIFRNILTTSP